MVKGVVLAMAVLSLLINPGVNGPYAYLDQPLRRNSQARANGLGCHGFGGSRALS